MMEYHSMSESLFPMKQAHLESKTNNYSLFHVYYPFCYATWNSKVGHMDRPSGVLLVSADKEISKLEVLVIVLYLVF